MKLHLKRSVLAVVACVTLVLGGASLIPSLVSAAPASADCTAQQRALTTAIAAADAANVRRFNTARRAKLAHKALARAKRKHHGVAKARRKARTLARTATAARVAFQRAVAARDFARTTLAGCRSAAAATATSTVTRPAATATVTATATSTVTVAPDPSSIVSLLTPDAFCALSPRDIPGLCADGRFTPGAGTPLADLLGDVPLSPDALCAAVGTDIPGLCTDGRFTPGQGFPAPGDLPFPTTPEQFAAILQQLAAPLAGAGLSPEAIRAAIEAAFAALPTAPDQLPSTPGGIVDLLVDGLQRGLDPTALGEPLAPVLDTIQAGLDSVLGALAGGVPTAVPTAVPTGLPTGLPTGSGCVLGLICLP